MSTLNLEKGQYLGFNRLYGRQETLNFADTTYHEKVFNGWHAHEPQIICSNFACALIMIQRSSNKLRI